MSFSNKLTLTFSALILLIVAVSLTSWWGMGKALESQGKLYKFHNDIEHSFHEIIWYEQEFTSEDKLAHSRSVYEHITNMQLKINIVLAEADDISQRELIALVLEALHSYEQVFSGYIQQNLNMQTSRSRMMQESVHLLANAEGIEAAGTDMSPIHRLMIRTLLAEKDFVFSGQSASATQVTDFTTLLEQKAMNLRRNTIDEELQLKAFRIAKAASVYKTTFDDFVAQHTALQSVRLDLRQALENLRRQLSRYIEREAAVTQQRIHDLQETVLATSLLAVILSILAALLFSAYITRPINLLRESAKKIVDGNLDTMVEIHSKDEIGELGNIFNQMAAELKRTFDTLKEYRDHLEERVKERTHELELEIIERTQAEEEVVASENRFREFFDNASDGIVIVDPANCRFVAANRMICSMLGYSEEELLAASIQDIHPVEALPAIQEELQQHAAGTKNIAKDMAILRKDGSVFQAEITSTRIEINKQPYLMGNFRDITDRKQMEEERLKARKLESIGILAGGIAHDFNNILAAILGNISLSLALTEPDDNRHKLLKEVEKASLRARDLTQQLLTFSKGGEPIKALTSINEIISESASFILRGSNVRCDVHCPDELWAAEVDPGQISQVIQNIVGNARHAMPTGGVITITCRNHIPDSTQSAKLADRHCLEICISDTGIGIPQKMLERIFDPYFTTKQEGSGLGLAITHSIINKHDGQISVESTPGHGTTFTILLPAVDAVVEHGSSEQSSPPQSRSGCIMVMDDEEAVRNIAGKMFTFLGCSVVLVADGEEAVAEYSQRLGTENEIDLTIMDITIPGGMGGKEAVGKILALNKDAKVVVSSGYSHDPIMAQFRKYGFVGVINKPFQLHDLQLTLQNILAPPAP